MIKKYLDKFMVWQLHNRAEIIIAVVAFLIGAILFLVKDFMPYEYCRTVQKEFCLGTRNSIRAIWNVHWR